MQMPGRDTTFKNGYRYGFNGKEGDPEPYGAGNEYDFGFRIYNPRIGRWFSTDLHDKAYLSPYQFGRNSPPNIIDPDGNDEFHFHYLTTYSLVRTFGADGSLQTSYKPTTYTWVQVVKNNLANTFYVHRDIAKTNGTFSPASPTQFFPDAGSTKRTGITTSTYFGFINRPDDDYTSLIKILDDFPELKGITGADAPSIRDPKKVKTLEERNLDFWYQVYYDKSTRATADQEQKQVNNFMLGVVTAAIPVEDILINASKIASEAVDIEGVSKNFNRFVKSIPVNSKGTVTVQVVEDGNILFSANSPGNVPGSSALYQKLVNAKGETLQFIKTTIDPGGNIVHVKDKIKNVIIKMPE